MPDEKPTLPARRSVRLKGFDYTQAGIYFVTVCTHNHRCLFGEVTDGKVRLGQIGRIVQECWLEIPHHFPGVELSAYVVMPNHVHGILALHQRARHAVPLRVPTQASEAFGQPVPRSVPTIIRSFKSAVSKRVRALRALRLGQLWQRNYFERVLRSGQEFQDAQRYILENPLVWEFDEENPHRRIV